MAQKQYYKNDNSQGLINNPIQQLQLSDLALNYKQLRTKLDINKHFSCIHVYKDQVYMGTRNSKLFIYKLQKTGKINKNQIKSRDQFNNQCFLTLEKTLTPHCQIVSLVAANQKYFVTVPQADEDSIISIWDSRTKMLLNAIKGHKGQVSQVIFLKNQKYMATACWDCNIRVFAMQGGDNCWESPVRVYTSNYPILVLKQFNEQILVFGGDDCYLVVWNWKKNYIIKKQFGHAGSVTYIQIVGDYVFTAGGDNKFKLWEIILNENQQQIVQGQAQNKIKKVENSQNLQKYTIKKIQQQKQHYDSIIFGALVDQNILLIDRQGEMFIFSSSKHLTHLKNFFQYNQNITGLGAVGYDLFITTTKGAVKHFNVKENKVQKEQDKKSMGLDDDNLQFNVVQIKTNETMHSK